MAPLDIFAVRIKTFFLETDNKILRTLGQCEPEMLTAVEIPWPEGDNSAANMDPTLRILCTLSELYDRELVAAIGWAKQIPGTATQTSCNVTDVMKFNI